MDTFSIIRNSLDQSENDPNKVGLSADVVEAGRVIEAVQTVVDALTPPTGGRWIVGFADIQTAGTSLGDQRITVSSKPLRDYTLSLVEKAVVIATFAAHEIGHTYVTRPRKMPVNLIQEHNAFSGYHSVANIADDIILEPFMTERFPILEDAFEFTGMWVLRTTAKSLPHRDTLNRETTTAGRFNILVHATRYGDIPEIEWNDENVRAERDWGRDWKRRLLLVPLLDHTAFLAMCDEFWDRVRTVDDTPPPEPPPLGESPDGTNPEPTDEQGDEPGEGGDGEGDDEDDESETQPGPSTDKVGEEPPVGDDFDEDTDEDGQPGEGGDESGEDGDGEDGDEPGGDTGSGDSEDGEGGDGDGDGDGDSHGGDWDGSKDDSDHDGDEPGKDGDYDGHDSDEQGGQHGDEPGGGGNAEADNTGTIRDEDDFDQSEVDDTTHDSAEQTDWRDEQLEAKVRTYDSTTVTAFGTHGTMSTTWE